MRRDEHRRQLVQAIKPQDGRMDEKRFDQQLPRLKAFKHLRCQP